MGSGLVGIHMKGMNELFAKNQLILGEADPPKSARSQHVKASENKSPEQYTKFSPF